MIKTLYPLAPFRAWPFYFYKTFGTQSKWLGNLRASCFFGRGTNQRLRAHCVAIFLLFCPDFGHAQTNVYPANGNVGFGTTSPGGKLEINHAGGQLKLTGGTVAAGLWTDAGDALYLADWISGTKGILINLTSGNVGIGTHSPQGMLEIKGPYSGNSQLIINTTGSNAELRFSDNGVSRGYVWYNKSNDLMAFGRGSTRSSLFINPAGNVSIGTHNAPEKLTVDGTVYAKEIKVDLSVPGPDYVFEKDYDLLSLDEVEQHIAENKHLPDVPSAKQMEENGIMLGEMNMLLLKKIEELTLYIIEVKKTNKITEDRLMERIAELESMIKANN